MYVLFVTNPAVAAKSNEPLLLVTLKAQHDLGYVESAVKSQSTNLRL